MQHTLDHFRFKNVAEKKESVKVKISTKLDFIMYYK